VINQLVKTRPPEYRSAAETCANVIRSLLLSTGRPFYSDLTRMTESIDWVIETSDEPLVAGWTYAARHAIPGGDPIQAARFIEAMFPMIGFSAAEVAKAVSWVTDKELSTFESQVFYDADARWLIMPPAIVMTLAKKLATELGKDKFCQWIDAHFMGPAIFYTKELKEQELAASSSLGILREVAI
jgi:hypothetical protein